jgi:2-keto-4-pentenoate hydratase
MTSYANLARRLRQAYTFGPVSPLRDGLEPHDVDGAYAVQSINTAFWQDQGRRITGRKIGLTAQAVQKQLGVDQPDFGVLFDDMAIPSGGTLDLTKMLQPKVEGEIAFVLGRDLTAADQTAADLAAAIRSAHAAIEIVDSRIADWKIGFADTVADNGSAAFYVLGEARSLSDVDLQRCEMVLRLDGEPASTGTGAAVLENPLNAAVWLARELATRGESLRAGEVILTGALGPMVSLHPGANVRVSVTRLGEVSFTSSATARQCVES